MNATLQMISCCLSTMKTRKTAQPVYFLKFSSGVINKYQIKTFVLKKTHMH